jgi:uncharacterized iron-regulated membrane protein
MLLSATAVVKHEKIIIIAITRAIYLLQPQIENLAYKDLLYLEKNFQKNPDHDAIGRL